MIFEKLLIFAKICNGIVFVAYVENVFVNFKAKAVALKLTYLRIALIFV